MAKNQWLHGSALICLTGNVCRDQPRQDDFRWWGPQAKCRLRRTKSTP